MLQIIRQPHGNHFRNPILFHRNAPKPVGRLHSALPVRHHNKLGFQLKHFDIFRKTVHIGLVQSSGSDPGAVVFDACKAAASRGTNILIVDTAGRLQNKTNLMEELRKINRIIEREAPQANVEVLLVLDSGTGQNAISQAKLFGEVVPLSGIILTKLDGTAKGGVVIGIANELNLPVKMIGAGWAHHLPASTPPAWPATAAGR